MAKANGTNVPPMDMNLEVVVTCVAGLDRAKAFSEKLVWWRGADFVGDQRFRAARPEWKR